MHICGPYSKVLNSNGGKYTYCWCAWKQVILGAVWNELLRQSCTSVARDNERTSTGAPCFPIMKLCTQKVWLHVSDLLFRLVFFLLFFFLSTFSTIMQSQIHNLCDLLLLCSLLSVMNANDIAESSCDCTAIVWAKRNVTGDQISAPSKTRHTSPLDNSSGLGCQSKLESD